MNINESTEHKVRYARKAIYDLEVSFIQDEHVSLDDPVLRDLERLEDELLSIVDTYYKKRYT